MHLEHARRHDHQVVGGRLGRERARGRPDGKAARDGIRVQVDAVDGAALRPRGRARELVERVRVVEHDRRGGVGREGDAFSGPLVGVALPDHVVDRGVVGRRRLELVDGGRERLVEAHLEAVVQVDAAAAGHRGVLVDHVDGPGLEHGGRSTVRLLRRARGDVARRDGELAELVRRVALARDGRRDVGGALEEVHRVRGVVHVEVRERRRVDHCRTVQQNGAVGRSARAGPVQDRRADRGTGRDARQVQRRGGPDGALVVGVRLGPEGARGGRVAHLALEALAQGQGGLGVSGGAQE